MLIYNKGSIGISEKHYKYVYLDGDQVHVSA
jgi:hypothetical protein